MSRMLLRRIQNLPLVLLGASLFYPPCSSMRLSGAINDPEPHDAVLSVLAAFDRYDLVALGEFHRNQNIHDFVLSLIRSADFPTKVNDIVVEFGNARYQSMMDRCIGGADVPSRELRRAWRDTVNILVWDAPVYERFFSVVREVNQHLPKNRRIRVLLGDPAFDWDQIQTKDQWEEVAAQRDEHAAEIIMKEVVRKRRKALLIYGSPHVTRFNSTQGGKANTPSLTELLEQNYAQRVFVIWPQMAGWGEVGQSYGRFAGWQPPAIALVKGTWLGELALGGPHFEEVADAFLYLGPVSTLRQSVPPEEIYQDASYVAELERRDRIQGGFNRAEVQRRRKNLSKPH